MKGFSLVELLLTAVVILIFIGLISFAPNPRFIVGKNRDATRLSDLSSLVVAVESYIADFSVPPDLPNTVRFSSRPLNHGFPPDNARGQGWIGANLEPYIFKLRVDPVNSGEFLYRYIHDGKKFKFDAVLEAEVNLMKNQADGGIDETHFEVGSGKEIVLK